MQKSTNNQHVNNNNKQSNKTDNKNRYFEGEIVELNSEVASIVPMFLPSFLSHTVKAGEEPGNEATVSAVDIFLYRRQLLAKPEARVRARPSGLELEQFYIWSHQ